MSTKKLYIGIDLGGTKIAAGLVTASGKILHQVTLPTEAQNGPKRVTEQIFNSINQLLKEAKKRTKDVAAIGIGAPGEVLFDKGIIVTCPNLPGISNLPLGKIISKKFKLKVCLDNDANAAAWGEYKFGAGKNCGKHMVFITISTGIGGGLVLDGKLYRGACGTAGEIGHMILEPNGPLCGCGKRGCLEALASGTAIARQANAKDAFEVEKAARKGDTQAMQIYKKAGFHIGVAVANAANLLDVTTFVIGGGVSNAGDLLFPSIEETAKKYTMKTISPKIKILPSKLKEKASILGAVSLCLK